MNFNVTVLASSMAGPPGSMSYRRIVLTWGMLLLLTLHLFVPFAAASGGMNSCDNSSCDDYDHNDDQTPHQQDWINATYDFKLVDTDTISLDIVWAIHEFNRSKLSFNSAIETTLESDGLDDNDGAPADLLRDYLDTSFSQNTQTIGEMLVDEFDSGIETTLSAIGQVYDQETGYVDEITQLGQTTPCSNDSATDSVYGGENAPINNVFQPPICLSSSLSLALIDTDFSISSSSGLDLKRAFNGMLIMGAEIEVDFTLLTIPGSMGYYSFSPPDYATITEVKGENNSLSAANAIPPYEVGRWSVDMLDAPQNQGDKETPISVKLKHRDGFQGTNTVSIPDDAKAIDLSVKLDLRDESAASIDFIAGISHLDDNLLEDWGVSLINLSDSAELPLVTSDGIRLAYHNGLVPLDAFTSAFPIDDIASGISDAVGSENLITMNPMYWVDDAQADGLTSPGGLNYTHGSGCTESNLLPPDTHYCLQGPSAMGNEYPVFLRSTSEPFSASLIDILKDNFGDGDLSEYVDVIQESDLRDLFNSGISVESVIPGDFLDSVIPESLPPAELTLEIVLPTWVRTADGGDRLTFVKTLQGANDLDVSLAGTDPYDWRTNIEDDDGNVLCTTLQRTCISSSVELDVSAFRINEWSQSISLDFALDAEVSIYRVMIPLDEINQSDSTKINFEAAPSDLLRLGLDLAGRLAEPKSFDDIGNICSEEQDYSVCEKNLSLTFTPDGLTELSVDIGEMITAYIQQSGAEIPNGEDSPFGQVDLSGFEIQTRVDGLSGLDQDIGDDKPITLSVKIPEVEFKLELDGNLGELADGNTDSLELNFFANAFRGLLINPLVSAAELLGTSLTNSVVSGSGITYPGPDAEATSISFDGDPSISEEYEFSLHGPISVILPRGITIEDVEDSAGHLSITNEGGRQKITYNVPAEEFENTISFRIKVSWLYLLMQFWVYPTFIIALLALFIRRRRRKKRLKKQRKAAAAQQGTKVAIGDSEFADLRGFKSEGLHGDLQQFEDYSTAAPPPMIDLGDERFD